MFGVLPYFKQVILIIWGGGVVFLETPFFIFKI